MNDSVTTPNGTTSPLDGDLTAGHPTPEATTRPLEDYAAGGPAADNPVVRLGIGTDVVALIRDEHGLVEVFHDGTISAYAASLHATPVVDPQRRIALLTQTLTVANAARRAAAGALQEARNKHTQVMAEIRRYAIDRHINRDIRRDLLDAALENFGLDPYEPRFRVSFTITGSYTATADDAATTRHQAETLLAANLDGIDGIANDSADYTVHVDEVERLDA